MDFERAIEHLLDLHARAEVRMDRADARMDRADARMDRAEARMDRLEKQVGRIQKLLGTGAKMLVQVTKAQREHDERMKALVAAQIRSEEKIDRLASFLLARPGNGGRRPGRSS